jgi:hypothetical protein
MLCCESLIEERSAGNPHATFCGNRRRVTVSGDPVGSSKAVLYSTKSFTISDPSHSATKPRIPQAPSKLASIL